MSRTAKFVAVAAASAAAVVVTAAPALAWTGGTVSASLTTPLVAPGGVTCSTSTLGGSVSAAGALNITSATIGGCTGGIGVTPTNLPWGGSLTNGGGPATITNFRVSALGCVYGGTLKGTNTAKSGTTPNASTTATFANQTVGKISGSFLCPNSATVSVTYKFTGAGI